MKKVLRVLLGIFFGLVVLLGLFFGLGVLGDRFWITTQLCTVFFTLVLPFLLIAVMVAAVVSLLVVRKGHGGKGFFRVMLAASVVAFAVLGVEAAHFKMVARDAGGSYSLLESLTFKDVQMSEPDEQVVYANRDGQDLTISIYKPDQTESATDGELRPVYVYMHGGGWSSNDADTNSNMHRQMADAGYVGFSINYRLCTYPGTSNPTWDKAIYDCADAMNWIHDHAREYGGDPDHIILAGESAGGNLVLHYAGMTSAGQLDAPEPQAVLAMYPVVDLQWTADNAHYMTTEKIPGICESYIGGELGEYPDRVKFVSPLTYMGADLPPVLILHGEKDTLVDVHGSEEYKRQADECGANVTLVELPYSNHGTDQQINRTVLLNWLAQFPGMVPEV
jgi:acetyl esterase/lipase